jgi:phospholipase C
MSRKQIWKATCASIAVMAMLENVAAVAAEPILTQALSTTSQGAGIETNPSTETPLSTARKIALLRSKVKYVFVLFQENRSFDHYFGTYPGANGLVATFPGAVTSVPANQTSSYTQNIVKSTYDSTAGGLFTTVSSFLAPRTIVDKNNNTLQLYPESFYSVDHSHSGYMNDFHLDAATKSVAQDDGYALDQEGYHYSGNATTTATIVNSSGVAPTAATSLSSKQKGEAVMAHVDCDTIPFLWHYADLGTLFDNIHQTITGPSTPNAIALIAGQSGATQWALHPNTTGSHTTALTVPNETDSVPFAGSASDTTAGQKPPLGPDEEGFATCATASATAGLYNNLACPMPASNDPALASWTNAAVVALDGTPGAYGNAQLNLTFASLPLSFMGSGIGSIIRQDESPRTDLIDVEHDIVDIASKNPAVSWGWYQQGFGPEPIDGHYVVDGFPTTTPHSSYIVHHNGPQYFGYLGDNPAELSNMHALQQFYRDVTNQALSPTGGVYYVRGGYYNNDGLHPADPSPAAQTEFNGNDDHGSYSDSQISETLVADSVNAIAASPYWSQSAIIITYDESDGFYDHVPPAVRSWGPDGLPLSGGARIPTIVLSPYMAAHTVSHVYSEHGSIIKFINQLFGLVPLSSLPDEKKGFRMGAAEFTSPAGAPQTALGPNDGSGVGDLLESFDNDKLLGNTAPLLGSVVEIPASTLYSLPHYGGNGCSTLGITPTDYPNGYGAGLEIDPPPSDFNPRPTVAPGIPFLEEAIYGGVIQPGNWVP